MVGRYFVAEDSRILPDEGAKAIWRRVQDMLLLLAKEGLGPGRAPELYVDPREGTYWELDDYEDGQITLRQLTREFIAKNWPGVDFDHPVEVHRPIRH